MQFDLEGARKAGYSDAEIAGFLSPNIGFDLDGAKNAGYSDREIVDTLTATPTVGDYGKSVVSGALSGVGMIAQGGGELLARGINKVAGTELRAENPLQGLIDRIENSQSIGAKRAVAESQISGSLFEPSTWDFGTNPNLRGIALQGLNAMGQMAPNLAIAIGTAGASIPAQLTIGATVGGLQALGGGAGEERAKFEAMGHDELMASSRLYGELIGKGVRQDVAKSAVAEAAALGGGIGNALPSAAEGAFENFLIGAITKGRFKIPAMFGKGVAGKAATGIIGGGMMGGAEEAIEQMGQNIGSNLAIGGNRAVTADTLQQFVMGALAEGAAGGGGAVAQHAFQPNVRPAETPPAPRITDAEAITSVIQAPTVDEAIHAASVAAEAPAHVSDVIDSLSAGIIDQAMGGAVDRAARAALEGPAYDQLAAGKERDLSAIQQAARESGMGEITPEDLQPTAAPGTAPWPPTAMAEAMRAAQGKDLLARMEALQQAKEVANAVPEPIAEGVDVRQPTGDGQALGEGNAQGQTAGAQAQGPDQQGNVQAVAPAEVTLFGRPVAELTGPELAVAARAHRMSAFREAAKAEIARRAAVQPAQATPSSATTGAPPALETHTKVAPEPVQSEAIAAPAVASAAAAQQAPKPAVTINGQAPREMTVAQLQHAAKSASFFDQKDAAATELKRRDKLGETVLGRSMDQLSDRELDVAARKHKKSTTRAAAKSEADRRAAADLELANKLKEPGATEQLQQFASEAGWAEKGGFMIRHNAEGRADQEKVTRTTWVPEAEWWPGRPVQENEQFYRDAVAKAIAGEPMTRKQKDVVRFLVNMAEDQLVGAEVDPDTTPAEAAAAHDLVGTEPAGWDSMSEEEKDAELDAKFGADTSDKPAAESAQARPQDGAGEVGPRSEQPAGERGAGQPAAEPAAGSKPAEVDEKSRQARVDQGARSDSVATEAQRTLDDRSAVEANAGREATTGSEPAARSSAETGAQARAAEVARPALDLQQQTASDLKAKQEALDAAAKKKAEEDAKAAKTPKVNAEQVDLFNTQGGLFGHTAQPGEIAPERFAVGKALTKEQRVKVLASLVDVYKLKNAPKEDKGVDSRGEEITGYAYSPDLFEKSDITGAMVRYYVTLPDGKIAHPTELFPDYTQSHIDAALAEQREKIRQQKVWVEDAEKHATDTAEQQHEYWQKRSDESLARHGQWRTIAQPADRTLLEKDGRFISIHTPNTNAVLAAEESGWKRAEWPSERQNPIAAAADALSKAAEALKAAVAPKPAEPARPAMDLKPSGEKNVDVGENLTANRRNFTGKALGWDDIRGLNDALKVREAVKAKVWPRPDYENLIADGMPALVARALKQVYDGIATAPEKTEDADLKRYVDAVSKVREAMFAWANDKDRLSAWANIALKVGGARRYQGGAIAVSEIASGVDAERDFGSTFMRAIWPEEMAKPRMDRFRGDSEALNEARAVGGNRAMKAMQVSIRDVDGFVKEIAKGWPAKQEAWERQGYQVVDRAKALTVREQSQAGERPPIWVIEINGRYVTTSRTSITAENVFPPEAKWLVVDKRRNVVGWKETEEEAKQVARDLTKREGKGGELRGMNIEAAERSGPERRAEGENVTSDRLMSAFGFRGVNFGREGWINQAERQAYLNHAYDGLMDLAEIMDVPPKALSMNGLLGIAFGAQGRGGAAAAHFVPGVNEINLTKTQGAGTLAHELGHALDHYFAVQAGIAKQKSPFLSENAKPAVGAEIRPEIVAAMKAVVEAMKHRPLTPDEQTTQRSVAQARDTKSLNNWLGQFKSKIAPKETAALAEFDTLAERIRKGDLGEGYVQSGNKHFPQVIGRIRELVKEATGRLADMKDTEALSAWATSLQFKLSGKAAEVVHAPQTTMTEYGRESRAKDTGKAKPYWSTEREMFARAFETYVADKLVERAQQNTFLSDAHRRAEVPDMSGKGFAQPYPRGEDRAAISAAIDKLVDEIQTRETDQGVAMFSRDRINTNDPVARAFSDLAQHDEAFRVPSSQSQSLIGVLREMAPSMHMVDYTDAIDTSSDSDFKSVTRAWKITSDDFVNKERPDRPRFAMVYEDAKGREVWVDLSQLKSGEAGMRLYQAVATYAHNRGWKFIGDPSGLSLQALYRRTEAMLSSALRHGTTKHLEPHDRQVNPTNTAGWQIRPLAWRDGDHANNWLELLTTAYYNVRQAIQEIEGYEYDFGTGQFRRTAEQGTARGNEERGQQRLVAEDAGVEAELGTLAESLRKRYDAQRPNDRGAYTPPLGVSAIKRAILVQSVVRSEGRDVLDSLPAVSLEHLSEALKGILYSRDAAPSAGAGLTETELSRAVADAFGQKAADRLIGNVLVPLADQSKLPAHVVPFVRRGDIIYGFFDPKTDKTYAVLKNLTPEMVRGLVMHEVGVHHGFEGMLGKEKYAQVMKRLDLMARTGNKAVQKARATAEKESARPSQIPEETLAYLVQNHPEMGFVRELIAAVKAFLFREFGMLGNTLTTDDMVALARASVQRAGLSQPGVTGALISFHKAFHGSPHDFDEFSLTKIGTGEGAQAYGFGLYFAGKREVAEHYRKSLSSRTVTTTYDGKPVGPTSLDPVERAKWELATRNGDMKIAKQNARYMLLDPATPALAKFYEQVRDELGKLDWQKAKRSETRGRLYEVNLAPDEADYLDWDKPLTEQSGHAKLVRDGTTPVSGWLRNSVPEKWTGENVYRALSRHFGNEQAASEYLHSSGIPGIKYLDGSSRNTFTVKQSERGKGWLVYRNGELSREENSKAEAEAWADSQSHRNYVLFDDKLVKVEAKFARSNQTETPEFKRWFGDSKVVDADGKPLVVYHGTTADITAFMPEVTGRRTGNRYPGGALFFTDNRNAASAYAMPPRQSVEDLHPLDEPNVLPVYLSMKNPLEVDAGDRSWIRVTEGAIKQAREQGRDGVIIRNVLDHASAITAIQEGPVNVYVAFRPEQVKSAIGNRGTFDPENKDIRFSRASWIDQQPADTQEAPSASRASWDAPEPSRLDNIIYTMQDKQVDTRRVLQAIRKNTTVSDALDVGLQEELYHGRTAKAVDDFLAGELKPLVTEMAARNVAMPEFEEYLHARHAEEANQAIAARNPELPDGGSGMKTQDAKDYLAKLDPAKRRAYEALAARVDRINDATRQTLVSYGLESQATIDEWKQAYQHYVPLHREDMGGGPGIGQGFSVRGPSTKMRTGSTRKVVDILANIATQREKAVVRGEKNRVSTALYGLAKANPNPDFWRVDIPPKIKYLDDRTGLVREAIDPLYKSRDNVVMARIPNADGGVVEHAVIFNEHDERSMRMAAALKNLDMDDLGQILGMSAKITRFFAAVNTQYNPVFGVVNVMRDVQGAMLNLTSTELRGKQADVLKNTVSALRGIYIDLRDVRAGKAATSSWAHLWEEFQKLGGQTGYRDMFRTSKDRGEAIEREISKVSEGKAKQLGRAVFDWLSDYNTAMENAVRLSAYKVGIDSGMTKERAASLAKNLTVNFNRKGQIATQAGALYAFFNASVQGTARLAETLAGPAGKKIIIGGLTLGVVQALALIAAGFDDDEPPDFVRERNLVIPIGDKKYITIPMPLGLHFLPNIGRVATEFTLSGFRDPGKRVASLTGVLADAFNPVGNAGVSLQTIAPTAIDPLAALAENKDWTGKPIAREDMNKLAPTPGHTRAKDVASAFSKGVSKGLNWMTGGTNYKPGFFSPTPDQIDYLIGQATGGVGREVMKLEQAVASTITGEDLPSYKTPLFGRFYGNTEQQSSQANTFYTNLKTLNEHEAELKGRRKAGEPIGDYLNENPEARLFQMGNQFERNVSQLRKRKRELADKDAPTEQIKAMDDRITAQMKRLNDRIKQVREARA